MSNVVPIQSTPEPPPYTRCRGPGCSGLGYTFSADLGQWYENRDGMCAQCGAVEHTRRTAALLESLKDGSNLPTALRDVSLERTVEPTREERDLYKRDPASAILAIRDRAALTSATAIVGRDEHGNRTTIERLKAWEPPASAMLVGPVESGKTHVAAAMAVDYMARYLRPALFLPESELFRNMRRRAGGASGPDFPDLLLAAEGAELLLFDDLGTTEKPKEWQRDAIEDVITLRYNRGRPTLITSNLSLPDLERAYGSRIASRIAQMIDHRPTSPGNLITLSGLAWRSGVLRGPS